MFQTVTPDNYIFPGMSYYEELFENGEIEFIEYCESIKQLQELYIIGVAYHGCDEEIDYLCDLGFSHMFEDLAGYTDHNGRRGGLNA